MAPTKAQLTAEVRRLRAAIRAHRENSAGHGLCWLNDVALWRVLDAGARFPRETLPVRGEFLAQCARYYASRLKGGPYREPAPKKTVSNSRHPAALRGTRTSVKLRRG